jgi:hypothetical protein
VSTTTPAATRLALLATLAVTGVAIAVFVTKRSDAALDPGFAAPFLWLFSSLFLVRVLGQLFVRLRRPTWLPPTEEWNLSPYKLLLPAQVAILALMTWIDVSFSLGRGRPVHAHPRLGEGVLIFAYVYAGAMTLRYLIRMATQPSERWFGGTIPIVFHVVLAAYLYVFGWFHASY